MSIKECYILDNSRGFQFYGSLNEDLVGTTGYNFYEVPSELIGKTIKVVDGVVVMDYDTEYNNAVDYQKRTFKEFKNEILKQIAYADAIGATDTVTTLKADLATELTAYETRVNNIVKGGS